MISLEDAVFPVGLDKDGEILIMYALQVKADGTGNRWRGEGSWSRDWGTQDQENTTHDYVQVKYC